MWWPRGLITCGAKLVCRYSLILLHPDRPLIPPLARQRQGARTVPQRPCVLEVGTGRQSGRAGLPEAHDHCQWGRRGPLTDPLRPSVPFTSNLVKPYPRQGRHKQLFAGGVWTSNSHLRTGPLKVPSAKWRYGFAQSWSAWSAMSTKPDWLYKPAAFWAMSASTWTTSFRPSGSGMPSVWMTSASNQCVTRTSKQAAGRVQGTPMLPTFTGAPRCGAGTMLHVGNTRKVPRETTDSTKPHKMRGMENSGIMGKGSQGDSAQTYFCSSG